jgi:hypothetical protein
VEIIASVFLEPVDWFYTMRDLSRGEWSALIGIVPFIPGGAGKKVTRWVAQSLKKIGLESLARRLSKEQAEELLEKVEDGISTIVVQIREAAPEGAEEVADDVGRIIQEEVDQARRVLGVIEEVIDSPLQIFSDPSVLAGKTPDDVRHLFSETTWKAEGLSGRSPGTRFIHREANGVMIQYSTGMTKRHFDGPYWKITGGDPGQVWVGPDGQMYTVPPNRIKASDGTISYTGGVKWEGSISLSAGIRRIIFGE